MSCPPLTVARRCQKFVDQILKPARIAIVDGSPHFLRRGRETDQVEVDAADKCPSIGYGGRLDTDQSLTGGDEVVDRCPSPLGQLGGQRRNGRTGKWLKRPPDSWLQHDIRWPGGTLANPLANQFSRFSSQRFGCLGHFRFSIDRFQQIQQVTGSRIAGNNDRAALASLKCLLCRNQRETSPPITIVVTAEAVLLDQRSDLTAEIDRLRNGWFGSSHRHDGQWTCRKGDRRREKKCGRGERVFHRFAPADQQTSSVP